MAAPHVAGLAALMLQANSTLTPAQILQVMQTTGVDISDPILTGTTWKRIDAQAAVEAVMPPAEFISITINDAELNFSSIDPGYSGVPSPNPLHILVEANTDYELTAEYGSSSFSGPGNLDSSYLEWNDALSGTYEPYSNPTIIGSGNTNDHYDIYHQLTIPQTTLAGDYSLNLIYSVRAA